MDVEFRDFQLTWPGQPVPLLDIPEWKMDSGAHVLLWGDSGKGKTTLLHCIGGMLEATRGDVMVEGVSYRAMGEARKRRMRRDTISMIFQRLNLLKHLTAAENVMLGIGGQPAAGKKEALKALARIGMQDQADRLAWHLSAGEQQRAAVARALARARPLTLADEPTANLDGVNAGRVVTELLAVAAGTGGTLIVVSHDERIRHLFDIVYNIEEIATVCPA